MVERKVLAVLLMAMSSTAFSASFDGPYVQVGIGGAETQNKVNYGSAQGAPSALTTRQSSFIGKVDAGWSQEIERFNLAGGFFYLIGNQNAGSNNFNGRFSLQDSSFASANQSYQLKNTWGINFEPGYYIANQTVGYLKFSWFNSRVSTSANSRGYGINETWGANGSSTTTINGAGYGVGLKQMVTNDIYGYVDYQYVQYSSATDGTFGMSFRPNQNIATVGIGYKF